MTASDTITFACPACGGYLSVPIQLAGITGPCPACNTTIRAPYPASPPPAEPSLLAPPASPAYIPPPAAPAYIPPPATPSYIPPPATPAYVPPAEPVVAPPVYEAPAPYNPPAPPANPAPLSYKETSSPQPAATLKPEPRQLPSRPHPLEHGGKTIPDTRDTGIPANVPPYAKPRRGGKMLRILLPLAFVGIILGIIAVPVFFWKKPPQEAATPPTERKSTVKAILPEDTVPAAVPLPAVEVKPAAAPAAQPLTEPPAGLTAIKVLEKFLAATTLQERLPWIETKIPEAELATSILAQPFPQTLAIETDFQDTNSVERVTDVFYNVNFSTPNGAINPQTILVRTRGDAAPKVVVEPLLDLLGGRLEAYAKAPSPKAATFQVIVSAGAFCYDETVPNREKKLTLKLLSRDNTKEIARAFFGKRSKIGEMLEDELSGLSYGQAKPCTVVLQWNTQEDSAKPYLEAINLKSLDWNP